MVEKPSHATPPKFVMAGLVVVPAIHALAAKKGVDARHKAGHDGGKAGAEQ
jgi:hypothetical protein